MKTTFTTLTILRSTLVEITFALHNSKGKLALQFLHKVQKLLVLASFLCQLEQTAANTMHYTKYWHPHPSPVPLNWSRHWSIFSTHAVT